MTSGRRQVLHKWGWALVATFALSWAIIRAAHWWPGAMQAFAPLVAVAFPAETIAMLGTPIWIAWMLTLAWRERTFTLADAFCGVLLCGGIAGTLFGGFGE